ncbi:hypothetical protein D8Y36_28210, partial [Escherichia coli]
VLGWKYSGNRHHPTEKPVTSLQPLIESFTHPNAYILAKGRPALPPKPLPDVLGWKYSGNRHHPTEKPVTSLQPLIESFTHPNA